MKTAILAALFCRTMFAQQTLTTETELTSGGDLSHYFIYHKSGLSAMVYYHRLADGTVLVETAVGPAWKWGNASLDTYLGGSNDRRLVSATVATAHLPAKLMIVAISDPKIAIGLSSAPTAWYNRLLLGREHLFFRTDGYWIKGTGSISRSLGAEANWKFKKGYELFSFISYDAITRNPGATAGLRINIQ